MAASLQLDAYEVSGSVSVQNNTSRLYVRLQIVTTNGTYNHTGDTTGSISVNGQTYSLSGKNVDYNTTTTLYEATHTVTHTADGSKTVTVAAEFDPNTPGTGKLSVSKRVTLTAIPRASTVGALDANVGSVSTVSVVRRSSAYTHTIHCGFGEISQYLNGDGTLSDTAVKLTATSIPFTIPESFYAQFPNAPTMECTLTCRTYSGSIQVGSDQTASFTVTADRSLCTPAAAFTVTDINSATTALTGDESTLVRYASTARCSLTATAKNSASIGEKTINGKGVTGSYLDIAGVQSSTASYCVTDSRGYTRQGSLTSPMVSYIPLTANVAAKRSDPTSGNAVVTVWGNYFDGSFGAKRNTLTILCKAGTQEQTLTATLSDGTYRAEGQFSGLDYQKSHAVTVTVADALNTLSRTAAIGKGIPVFDWGETDFNFSVPVSVPAPTADSQAANRGYVKENAVQKSGDTMTGVLKVPSDFTVQAAGYPAILFVDTDDGQRKAAVIGDMSTRRMYMRSYATDTEYYENFHFPSAAEGLTGNKQYSVLTTKSPVTVAQGGTGATSAAQAREKLGFGSKLLASGSWKAGGSATFSLSGGNLFVIVGRTLTGYSLCSAVVPKAAITTENIRWQIADNQYYVAFNLKYAGDTVTLSVASANNTSGEITAVYGIF